MDNFFNKEFYINLGLAILLTVAAIVSDFNYSLTIIMGTTWTFFTIIHVIKLSASIKGISLNNVHSSDVIGK